MAVSEKKLLPPRLKDWKKGVPQIGVFIRSPRGGTLEMVNDKASLEAMSFALWIIAGLDGLDPKLVQAVHKAWQDKK